VSTKSEQLRELARQIHAAEAANPGVEQLQFEAAERLREFADRLDAVAVSDAMVECASDAYATLSLDGVDMTAMRHALESILPIADEKAKDAECMKGLRELLGYVENGTDTTVTLFQDDATRNFMVKVGSRSFYGSSLQAAIDRAIASAKGDATK